MTNERLDATRWCNACLIGIVAMASAGAGHAQRSSVGVYLCTTEQRAAIASDHREGSGPPIARVDGDAPTTFKMRITEIGKGTRKYEAVELPYEGGDRDRAEWQDENTVLHSIYVGDGAVFHAKDGPAFLTLVGARRSSGASGFGFYHAGFELPGGEDTQLAVRWGRCRKAD